jgi:hypothetical protein
MPGGRRRARGARPGPAWERSRRPGTNLDPRRADPVAADAPPGCGPGERQVGRGGEMPRIGNPAPEQGRLEQARVVVPHHLGRGDSSEVGRALVLAARAEGLAEREQHNGARKQRSDEAEHQQRRLAPLAARTAAPIPDWLHSPGPSTAIRYISTRERTGPATRPQRPARGAAGSVASVDKRPRSRAGISASTGKAARAPRPPPPSAPAERGPPRRALKSRHRACRRAESSRAHVRRAR